MATETNSDTKHDFPGSGGTSIWDAYHCRRCGINKMEITRYWAEMSAEQRATAWVCPLAR